MKPYQAPHHIFEVLSQDIKNIRLVIHCQHAFTVQQTSSHGVTPIFHFMPVALYYTTMARANPIN